MPAIAATVKYGPLSRNHMLAVYACPAASPDVNPQVAQALAIRGARARSTVAITTPIEPARRTFIASTPCCLHQVDQHEQRRPNCANEIPIGGDSLDTRRVARIVTPAQGHRCHAAKPNHSRGHVQAVTSD